MLVPKQFYCVVGRPDSELCPASCNQSQDIRLGFHNQRNLINCQVLVEKIGKGVLGEGSKDSATSYDAGLKL